MLAVHVEHGSVSLREVDVPQRRQAYALIRLRQAGICSTDLHLQRGYYGFAGCPGHEFVGDVVACDSARWLGKRVCGEINLACGTCDWCSRDLGRHCPNRTVLGIVKHPGAFAEYLTLPETNLHEVPEAVPDDRAVFVEPVAAACEILDQVKIPDRARVCVLGDGKLGLLIAQILQLNGARVRLAGRHPEKMKLLEPLGVETVGSESETFDFVVDATGSSEGLQKAIALTRPRGTLVLKSTVHDRVSIDTAPLIVNELTLVGSRCGRFQPAMDWIASGKLVLDALIQERYALQDAPRAFERAASKGVLKVLLTGR